ncbi:MAG: histidine kinase [Lachnospiraceae bacterium]|nr:histidine kinase [Lachnospiraceae bacterium]
MKKYFNKITNLIYRLFSNYRARLFTAFFICALIPLITVGSINYYTSYQLAQNRILESVSVSSKQLVQQLNNRFSQMESVADSVNQYAYNLNQVNRSADSEYMDSFSAARSNINMLNQNFHLFQSCVFLPDDSFVSNEGLMFFGIHDLFRFQIDPVSLSGIGVNSKWIYRRDVTFPQLLSPVERKVNTIFCCQSLSSNNFVSYAVFTSIKSSELNEMLIQSYSGTSIHSFICTPDRDIVASNQNNDLLGKVHENQYYQLLSHHGEDFFLIGNMQCNIHRLSNGFLLVTEIPSSYIQKNTYRVVRATILIFFILIPLVFCIILFTANGLSRKLMRLDKIVRSTSINENKITAEEFGHLFQAHSHFSDEIDHLAASYHSMLKTIDENLASIIALTVNEEQLKYKLLQSQINPHFLYNILGSIQTCLTIGKNDIAIQMAQDLSKFYRITLRKNNDLISIHEELEIATLYLELEKLLKQDAFSYEVHCEDGLEYFQICKFTLQPFLENSIHHGLQSSENPIHICLNLTYGEDTIIITIADNGSGMDTATLQHLQSSLQSCTVDYTRNFGICNVNARIASPLYGAGKIQIESSPHQGTRITIEYQQMLSDDPIDYLTDQTQERKNK